MYKAKTTPRCKSCLSPKPFTISNLLHSQHQSDDQPKDTMNKPLFGGLFVKTRLANFVYLNG